MAKTIWREVWVEKEVDFVHNPNGDVALESRRIVIREVRELSLVEAKRAIPMGGPAYALWQLRQVHWMAPTPSGRSIQAGKRSVPEREILNATVEEIIETEKAISGSAFAPNAPLRWVTPGDALLPFESHPGFVGRYGTR